jgi:hypothetical protein
MSFEQGSKCCDLYRNMKPCNSGFKNCVENGHMFDCMPPSSERSCESLRSWERKSTSLLHGYKGAAGRNKS